MKIPLLVLKKMQAGCENEDKSNQSYYGCIEK